ncbi:uncharacterized protein NPIL_414801 [Nephila pilipes]|uniref:Peptidase S1 domain-containing protein n=1 Tax=Nephila pilipes TaxID=299642 RepID=A0A8X6I3T6_NEPPI|nr:uncharacterized protein NPIL_414801 [Nephila pilipes]
MFQEVFIVLGERDLMSQDRNQYNFYPESIVIHPDFKPLDSLENNLALIKLNARAPEKRFRPACLPPLERNIPLHLDLNINASIAGWGQPPSNENEWEITGSTVHFRSWNISATLEEESVCRRFNKKGNNAEVFCAGGHGISTCIGDIGSPIVAVDLPTKTHHLIGVLSKKSLCRRGVNEYIELTKFTAWINETTMHCHSQHYMV